ncbi:hypothetical protein [Streptomyces xanthochromogenes]|uniref:hypothetical protein n=1 Tax=Streptomyces xanthochromogenes TaxID=67384 RepID=UPI002F3F3B9F
MQLSFTDQEVEAAAVRLGLIEPGAKLPAEQRSRVIAAVLAERQAQRAVAEPARLAQNITIQPGGDITVDGVPLPWLVARDRIEVSVDADAVSTVRLTLLAASVQILKPPPESENRA